MSPSKWLTALAALAAVPSVAAADPLVVDRIVAVVDTSPVLLSEVSARARPFELHFPTDLSDAQRAELLTRLKKQVVEMLIDRRLIAADAKRRGVEVTHAEVVHTLEQLAAYKKRTLEEVLADAAREGLDRNAYEAEIQAQILEGKLLRIVAFPHGAPTTSSEKEAMDLLEKAKQQWIASLRQATYIDVRL